MNAPPTDPRTTGRLPSQRHRLWHQRDALDVTLHDDELRDETELTAHLMVAVNDAAETDVDAPLPQYEVDRLLGLAP